MEKEIMITMVSMKSKYIIGILLLFVMFGCNSQKNKLQSILEHGYETNFTHRLADIYVNIFITTAENKENIKTVCLPITTIISKLAEDSLTKNIAANEDYLKQVIVNQQPVVLPVGHTLFNDVLQSSEEVQVIYNNGGYKALLQNYFFRSYIELNDWWDFCLDKVHSACDASVYYRRTPVYLYYRDDDVVMDVSKQLTILSLLFQNGIYCYLDENGNTSVLSLSQDYVDIIPFPVLECR